MERRWKVLVVVSGAVFMVSLDLFIVNIAFPDIGRDFSDADLGGLSWVLNAYAIVFAALLVPAGRIADRAGRRRAFLGGLIAFVAASAACAAAPSVEVLVAARVAQAAAAAFLLPTSLALLLPEFPPEKRAAAIGVWAAVGGVAAAAGPPVGGLLVELSWRWVFIVNVPFGLAAAYAGVRVLHETRDADALRPDLLGTILLACAVGLLALGLVKAPDWGWGDERVIGSLAAAVLGLAAFLRRSARHPAPVVDLPMLRVRSFAMANAAALLFTAGFAAMLLTSVLFLTRVWGEPVLEAGLAIAPGPIMAAVFAVPAGRLADRAGHRTLAAAGCLVFALGSAWWAWQVGATEHYASEFLPGLLLTGVGVGLTLPTLASAAAAALPPARFATGSAVLSMSRQLGAVLGVAILVAVLGEPSPAEAPAAFDDAWAFIALAAAAGALAGAAIGRVGPHGATVQAATAGARA
jgi:EmrB/QacA subfamily drug resistance transporter